MTDEQIFSIVLISISILITLGNVLLILKSKSSKSKPRYNLDDYIKVCKDNDVLSILETRIEDVLSTYVLMNIAYKDSVYISTSLQEQMTSEIYVRVISELPPDYIYALKILYDDPFKEIERRVTLAIMGYVVETNGNYKE